MACVTRYKGKVYESKRDLFNQFTQDKIEQTYDGLQEEYNLLDSLIDVENPFVVPGVDVYFINKLYNSIFGDFSNEIFNIIIESGEDTKIQYDEVLDKILVKYQENLFNKYLEIYDSIDYQEIDENSNLTQEELDIIDTENLKKLEKLNQNRTFLNIFNLLEVNEDNVHVFRSQVKANVKRRIHNILDVTEQENLKEALSEGSQSQLNEDRGFTLNPKTEVTKLQALFLSSLSKGTNGLQTNDGSLHKEYHNPDLVKNQLLTVLSVGNNDYYNLTIANFIKRLQDSNYPWVNEFLSKLEKLPNNFSIELANSNYKVLANFKQAIINKKGNKTDIRILPTNDVFLKNTILNNALNYITISLNGEYTSEGLVIAKDKAEVLTNILNEYKNKKVKTSEDLTILLNLLGFPVDEEIVSSEIKVASKQGVLIKKLYHRFNNVFNNIIKDFKFKELNNDTVILDTDRIFSNSIFTNITNELSKKDNYIIPIMNKDGDVSTANHIIPNYFYNIFLEIQNSELSKIETVYNKVSDWLNYKSQIKYSTVALQPYKKKASKRTNKKISQTTKANVEHLSVLYFFGNRLTFNKENNLKKANYLTPTYSDKGKVHSIEAYARKFNNDWFQDQDTIDFLFSQLIQPDLNRITEAALTTRKLKKQKPFYFYSVPELNNIKQIQKLFKNTDNITTDTFNELMFNEQGVKTAFRVEMEKMMIEFINEGIETVKNRWSEYNIGLKDTSTENEKKYSYNSIDNTVLDEYSASYDDIQNNIESIQDDLVRDYYINYAVALQNMQLLYFGDPSQYATKEVSNSNFYELFLTNLSKRLGKANSPSSLREYRHSNIRYGIIGDNTSRSLNMLGIASIVEKEVTNKQIEEDTELSIEGLYEDLSKEEIENIPPRQKLIDIYDKSEENVKTYIRNTYFPNSKSFFEIDHADAQEFVHWIHRLEVLYAEGLSVEDFNKYVEEILEGGDVKPKNSNDKLFGARKQVYVGHRMIQGALGQVKEDYYIKSSDITVFESFYKGTPLEKIIQHMNPTSKIELSKLKKDENGAYILPRPRIERLAFESAVKQGLPNDVEDIFNVDFTVKEELISKIPIVGLPSKFLGNQVEVPVKDKKYINDSIQYRKLISINNATRQVEITEEIESLFGKGFLTIADLEKRREKLLIDMVKLKRDKIISKITTVVRDEKDEIRYNPNTNDPLLQINRVKLHDLLIEEMQLRNWDINERNFLKLIGEGNSQVFAIPLYATSNPGKFNSLISSLINNSVVSDFKRWGYAGVQASSLGLNTDYTDVIPEGAVFTKNFTGKLHYLSRSNVAQVLIPWRFKADVEFFKDENGIVDPNKLPPKLLRGIGYRIPGQGQSSMFPFEIVGFLPESMDNTVIVPTELVTQMGSDFDVDKLYSYLPSSHVIYRNEKDRNFLKNELKKITTENKEIEEYLSQFDSVINEEGEQLSDNDKEVFKVLKLIKQHKNNTAIDNLKKKLQKLEEGILIRSVRGRTSVYNSKLAKLNDELFDIEYAILNTLKNEIIKPLDSSLDELTDIINNINSKNNYSELNTSFIDVNYQRDKFAAGTSSAIGTGVFSQALTFLGVAQKLGITSNNTIPLSIDSNQLIDDLGSIYENSTLKSLKELYKNNSELLEGKVVAFNNETNKLELVTKEDAIIRNATPNNLASFLSRKFGIEASIVSKEFLVDRYEKLTGKKINNYADLIKEKEKLSREFLNHNKNFIDNFNQIYNTGAINIDFIRMLTNYFITNNLQTDNIESLDPEIIASQIAETYNLKSTTNQSDISPEQYKQIEELLDSDPELANEVYSAMGFDSINESDITYTDEEGNPCAKMGLTNTTKGTGWKIVKDFKGQPKHSQGGVDIFISDKGVSMRREGKDIKAAHGLLIPNNN